MRYECLFCGNDHDEHSILKKGKQRGCPTCTKENVGSHFKHPVFPKGAAPTAEYKRTLTAVALKAAVRSYEGAQKQRIALSQRQSKNLDKLGHGIAGQSKLQLKQARELEVRCLETVKTVLEGHEMWPWMEAQTGIGPVLAGTILAEMGDILHFPTVNHLKAYVGLNTKATSYQCLRCLSYWDDKKVLKVQSEPTGQAFLCPKCWDATGVTLSSTCRVYTSEATEGAGNKRLRTKLLGVLPGSVFAHSTRKCRQHKDAAAVHCNHCTFGGYSKIYAEAKLHYLNMPCCLPAHKHGQGPERQVGESAWDHSMRRKDAGFLDHVGCTRNHVHRKAVRVMVQQFLRDLFYEWHNVRGLTPQVPAKLVNGHHKPVWMDPKVVKMPKLQGAQQQ